MRKKIIAVALLLSLICFLPVNSSSSKINEHLITAYEETNTPFYEDVTIYETDDFVRFNNSLSFYVDFYKGGYGYNKICFQNGTVLVYNDRIVLESLDGQNWKQTGIPIDLTYEIIDNNYVTVTRYYTNFLGTNYNIVYHIVTGLDIKIDVQLEIGDTKNYRLYWNLNGITIEDYFEDFNKYVFGNRSLIIDWSDVYHNLGNITATSIESVANGLKANIYFNLGALNEGDIIELDPYLVDSYSELNRSSESAIQYIFPSPIGISAVGQSFTGDGSNLTLARFYLRNGFGSPEFLRCDLYAHSGVYGVSSKPTGAPLANSDLVNVSYLAGAYEFVDFEFNGTYTLGAGTYYVIVVKGYSGIDISNYVYCGTDNSSPTHDGNGIGYVSGSWVSAVWDTIFYVYGAGAAPEIDYVDQISNVDGSADIGSHSNFTAQQFAPDSDYDALTEAQIGATSEIQLWVDGFTAAETGWTLTGSSPYLDAIDDPTNIIETKTASAAVSRFNFTDLGSAPVIVSVELCIYAYTIGGDGADIYLYNSSGLQTVATGQAFTASYAWYNYTVTSILPSKSEIDAGQLRFVYWFVGGAKESYIDAALLRVVYYPIWNYRLDIEEEWIGADYTQSNEELCIYMGTFTNSEQIYVQWRNPIGSWVNITGLNNLSPNSWSNASVSSYLNSSNFVIRFLDGIQTGDSLLSSWQKDSVLLHTWTPSPVYLTVIFYTGIDQIQVNGSNLGNGSSYSCIAGSAVSVLTTERAGYSFLWYNLHNHTISWLNPYNFTLNLNQTIYAVAYGGAAAIDGLLTEYSPPDTLRSRNIWLFPMALILSMVAVLSISTVYVYHSRQ